MLAFLFVIFVFTQNHTFCLELYSLHLAFLAAIDITAFTLETLKVCYDPIEDYGGRPRVATASEEVVRG